MPRAPEMTMLKILINFFLALSLSGAQEPFPLHSKLIGLKGEEWRLDPDLVPRLPPAANKTPTPVRPIFRDPSAVIHVVQGEYAILSDGDPNYRFLGTGGAGPCVVLVLLDTSRKILTLGHFDGLVDLRPTMHEILNQMQSLGAKDIHARLFGAIPDNSTLRRVLDALEENGIPLLEFTRFDSVVLGPDGEFSPELPFSITLNFQKRFDGHQDRARSFFAEWKLEMKSCNRNNIDCSQAIEELYVRKRRKADRIYSSTPELASRAI